VPSLVTAEDGDCLCIIAISSGFINCQPLRDEPANSSLLNRDLVAGDIVTVPDIDPGNDGGGTDQRHVFVRRNAPPVSIRMVHGSPNLPYLQDADVPVLHISNHQTTRGGTEDGGLLPSGFGFNQLGHDDPDTFKVEVVDPQAASPVMVRLEALKRTLLPNGTFGHDLFPAGERGRRSLDPLECEIVSSGVAFRSRYLRLVTDDTDKTALPNQTLLVTDMTDEGDSTVEILEQAVRATYTLQKCPVALCKVSATRPVGDTAGPRKPRTALRMAVHILTTAPGAAGAVTIPQADRRITRWVRRTYAQAGIAPRLVQSTRIVDPQNNLVAIGEPHGVTARGDGQMGFRITSPGNPTLVIGPIPTVARAKPADMAAALAALVTAPYVANVTVNPAGFNDPVGNRSADIVVTVPGGLVTIDQEISTDARQVLTVGRPNTTSLAGFSDDFLIGSSEQRALLKTYDTGEDRVDVFVVQDFAPAAAARGQAMMHGVSIDRNRPAIAPVRFSVFVNAASMNSTDDDFVNLSHEMGHVLEDLIHATGTRSDHQLMMGRGTTFLVSEPASKRIKERPQLFDSPAGLHRQIDRIHDKAQGLLEAF
jgi:hypothetical protein